MNAISLSASLTVKDLTASLAWYQEVLGFTISQKHERNGVLRAISLAAGSAQILINQDDGAKGTDRAKGEGLSFMLTTGDNIDELAARAKAAGATLDSEPAEFGGRRAFRLRDPDGFRFTISTERRL
ncbi:MAG TPA: VOC family protein [Gemmatimonadaceae bacterium]|nr:VOC family protein [Gemmatimonadaceae bacterium]